MRVRLRGGRARLPVQRLDAPGVRRPRAPGRAGRARGRRGRRGAALLPRAGAVRVPRVPRARRTGGAGNQSLTALNLRYNGLGTAACAALADALRTNHTLTFLNVSANNLQTPELPRIMPSEKEMPR